MRSLLLRLATSRVALAVAGPASRGGARCHGPAQRPNVALTFDDGPDPRWTPRVLDALAAADARATFFCTGKAAAEHPDLVRRAAGEGHEIGTHLWSHARTTVDHDHAFATELESSRQLLAELTGQPVRWLRFPYGRAGRQHQRRLPAPVEAVHWTVSSHDSRLSDPAAIIARVVAALRPGAIVLLHDGIADEHEGPVRPPYQPTRDAGVAALPTLLTSLTMRGYAPVTLSGLWADASRAAAA